MLQVSVLCYEYSRYEQKASSLELQALKALARGILHHFRGA